MAEIKKVLEENTDLKLRNEKLREAVAQLELAVDWEKQTNHAQAEKLQELYDRINSLKKQNTDISYEHNKLIVHATSLSDTLESFERDINELENQLAEIDLEHQKLQERYEHLNQTWKNSFSYKWRKFWGTL